MDAPLNDRTLEQSSSAAQSVLRTAQLLYLVLLTLAFLISASAHTINTSRTKEAVVAPTVSGPNGNLLLVTKKKKAAETDDDGSGHHGFVRSVFLYLTGAVVLSLIANGAAVVVHVVQSSISSGPNDTWWCGDERIVYVVGAAFLYLSILVTLPWWRHGPVIVHLIVWSLSLVGESVILIASIIVIAGRQHMAQPPKNGVDGWNLVDLSIAGVRVCLLIGLIYLYTAVARTRVEAHGSGDLEANESSPLLNGSGDGSSDAPDDRDEAAFYRPKKLPYRSWFEYCRGYSVFFPYLWPSKSAKLQIVVLLCFMLVILQRLFNVLNGNRVWLALGLLVLYRLLKNWLGSVRSMLWVPVSQHTYRALTAAAFEHVHSLSLDFHLGKHTGEVLSALNKGGAINQFLEQVTFQVVPMLVDLLVAIIYFYVRFGSLHSLFVSIITFCYLYMTIRMAATRADQRRDIVNADREEEAVKNDSITSYETVKYFNAETREFERYGNAVRKFQDAEAKVLYGINRMNMTQSGLFLWGELIALLTCGYQVRRGDRSVGDLFSLLAYLNQLQDPLNFFSSFYRTVQSALISGERLLELFKIQPTVVDKPSAMPLLECSGNIRWNQVCFAYDGRRPALRDLSFEYKPGTTTAFVGESGGGKSTVFRLIFRYYDCHEGSIEIDGHDVKDLTIDSVRRLIGVVPQDIILFNETLMYNLKYANPMATDEEVFDTCRAAAIHDRILSFPDGYLTKVGERGIRLSGGEKQRVAIVHTILKNPKIIMLDEATSALDGETEQEIQSGLISGKFGQDRTLLIIAHRLSTITHADQILVLHAGTVAERGTHQELLDLNGRYAAMWEKHCRDEQANSHYHLETLGQTNTSPDPLVAANGLLTGRLLRDTSRQGTTGLRSTAAAINLSAADVKAEQACTNSVTSSTPSSSHAILSTLPLTGADVLAAEIQDTAFMHNPAISSPQYDEPPMLQPDLSSLQYAISKAAATPARQATTMADPTLTTTALQLHHLLGGPSYHNPHVAAFTL
ncbi:hypothetical protein VTG60DRAFT_3867 [Thermothelomyces hinnuleus]